MENSTSYQEWNTWLFLTIHWPYFCTVAVASEYSTGYLWCLRCYGLLVHPWRLFMGWKTQESRGDGFKGGQIIVSLMHMSVGFSHRRLQCLVRAYGTKKFMAFIAWAQRRPWLHQILMWPETCSATLTSQTNMILNNPLSYWCLERRWDLQPLPINFFNKSHHENVEIVFMVKLNRSPLEIQKHLRVPNNHHWAQMPSPCQTSTAARIFCEIGLQSEGSRARLWPAQDVM